MIAFWLGTILLQYVEQQVFLKSLRRLTILKNGLCPLAESMRDKFT